MLIAMKIARWMIAVFRYRPAVTLELPLDNNAYIVEDCVLARSATERR